MIWKKSSHTILATMVLLLMGSAAMAQPAITSISPLSANPGSTVTINGSNFSSTASNDIVFFNGIQGAVTSATSTQLKVTVPVGAMYGPISVTVSNKTAYSTGLFIPRSACGNPISSSGYVSADSITVGNNPQGGVLADLDGDGKLDMVICNYDDSTISILRNKSVKGKISFASAITKKISSTAYQCCTGDLDGDGKLDLIVSGRNIGDSVYVLQNASTPGSISFSSVTSLYVPDGPMSVKVQDMDADGKPDIVVISQYFYLYIFKNGISGSISSSSFTASTYRNGGITPYAYDLQIADMNGDGKPDIIIPTFLFSDQLEIWINNGSLSFTGHRYRLNYSPWGIALGDFNKDGSPDVVGSFQNGDGFFVVPNTSSGGSFSLGTEVDIDSGASGFFITPADLDGDGNIDIVSGEPLQILPNTYSSGSSISFGTPFNLSSIDSTYIPLVGDLDGDGRPDIYAPKRGKVYGFRNVSGINAKVIVASSKSFCSGDSLLLKASTGTGYSYQWMRNDTVITGATDSMLYAKVQGRYKVMVQSSGGCNDTSSADTLTVIPLPLATITASGSTTICAGGSVTLSAPSGTGYTYQWQKDGSDISGANSASYMASASGSYSVKVANANGCSSTSAVKAITVLAGPNASINIIGNTTRCSGDSVVMVANTISGYTYQWKKNGVAIGSATTTKYAAKTSGIYKVVISNSNGCTDSSAGTTVTINALPTAVISTVSGPTTFCSGGSVTLGALTNPGNTYQWLSNGTVISGATSSTYTVNQGGNYAVMVTNGSGCSAVSSATAVTVNSLPSTTVTPYGTTTRCQGDSVILDANSVPGYTYQWKLNGAPIAKATSSSYAATASGMYRVVITNASGCTDSSSGTIVTINPLPSAKILASTGTSICAGGNAYLSLSAMVTGISYQWQMDGKDIPGANSSIFLATQAGTYTVRATNANGCSNISNAIKITVNALPNPAVSALGATSFCQGDSVQLITAALGGSRYQWQMDGVDMPGDTNANVTVKQSGAYRVVVTNASGCTDSSKQMTITVNPMPNAQILPFSSTSFCIGGSVQIKVRALTAGTSYQWFKDGVALVGDSASFITASQTGSYTVVQTIKSTGCSVVSNAVNVTAHSAPVSLIQPLGNTTFCSGGSVVLYAGAASGRYYYWYRNGSYINVGNVNTITVTDSGSYTLVTQDSMTMCSSASKAVVVNLLPLPDVSVITSSPTTLCEGASAVLYADRALLPAGKNTYQWFMDGVIIPGAISDSILVTKSGNYALTVTSEAGCVNTSRKFTMTFNAAPVVKYSFPRTICAGSPVNFVNRSYVPNGELTYVWTFGDGDSSFSENPSHAYVSAGRYKIVLYATSGSGCVSMFMDSISVHAATRADFKAEHTGPRRFTFTAQDTTGMQYHWIFGDGSTGSGKEAQHDYFIDGTYQVILQATNASGCVTSFADSVSVNSTGIEASNHEANSLSVYPNPFIINSNINYTLAGQSNVTLEVYDMLGQKVETIFNGLQPEGKYTYTFDSRKQGMPSDVYFVKLRVDQNVYIQRLVRVQ